MAYVTFRQGERAGANVSESPTNLVSNLAKGAWYYLALRGAVAIVFGILALVWPDKVLTAFVLLLGIFWAVDGVLAIVHGIRTRGTPGAGSEIFFGILGAVAGVFLIVQPDVGATILLIVAGVWAIIGGLILVISAVRGRKSLGAAWTLGLALGVITLAFGIFLVAAPDVAATTFGILLGIYALLAGIVLVMIGLSVRAVGRSVETPAP
ncbi:HdeD family acid-resistance protein [Occultella aeris]|uniref:Acid-resistance membrane protein n=1 Tax=Occultella aeris TaxID=2761496 RepID=A0A7M4DLP4_9MICO|nr:acid-resistance membrane protein [Occultella aeris]